MALQNVNTAGARPVRCPDSYIIQSDHLQLHKDDESRAIRLQNDCMVAVPAPVVRLPDSHVYALWP